MKRPDPPILAAMMRMTRVIAAFNNHEPTEQCIFVERLTLIFSASPPVAAFEADRLQCEAENLVRLACAAEEAYALAFDDEIVRRAAKGRRELRRVFACLWGSLSQQDRAAFLSHVSERETA